MSKSYSHSVLIIGFVWPEPNSSAAGRRMMDLIALFQAQGWEITFASAAAESDHMADLAELGIDTVPININDSAFDKFIQGLQPSLVMFDRFVTEEQFGWRVAKNCPEALRLLDTEDLHCLRRARGKALKQGSTFRKEDLLLEETARREVASILRCDLSLIISVAEMQLLEDLFDIDKSLLHYLPFTAEPLRENNKKEWLRFEDRRHFVMIGNFSHAPNMDAVRYASEEIWPLIRSELPGEELHIYGAYPTADAKNLNNPDEGFYIKGRVEDARKAVGKARVSLAPLRFGAGLKGKLLESMQCGTPIVTTPVGAEGMHGELTWPGAIARDPDTFASAAVELYTDRLRWEEAQAQGVEINNKRFADPGHQDRLISRIKTITERLEKHRKQNFTGAMLRYHTVAAQEYMSRWIEAKNRLKEQ